MNSAAVDLPSFRSARGERNEPPGTATTAFSDSKFSIQSLKLLRPIDANVAKLMLDNHISGVPVVDEFGFSSMEWSSSAFDSQRTALPVLGRRGPNPSRWCETIKPQYCSGLSIF
jgi:hypothetical protein